MSSYRPLLEECCQANRKLPELGLVDFTFGNISIMDRDRGVFVIKPSGVPYEKLKANDMVALDLDGKVRFGKLRPSSDTPTHMRLYQQFPQISAIVHTHSLNATIFAQAGHGIPCLGTTHADHFYGEIPVTRPMKPEEVQEDYEWNTANVIIERFDGLDVETMPAVLVNSHGPFTWGDSGVKAIEAALALELVAEMALKSLLLNPVASPIPDFLLNKHYLRKHGENAYYGQPDPSQISP